MKIGCVSFVACLSFLIYENTGQALYGVSHCEKYVRDVSYFKLEKKIEQLEERLEEQDRRTMRLLASRGCITGEFQKWFWPARPSWPLTKYIKFEPPFSKTPAISFGMTHLRSDYRRNVRAIVKTKNITRYGFELILKSDGDTIQWALGATWMACPAR